MSLPLIVAVILALVAPVAAGAQEIQWEAPTDLPVYIREPGDG